MVTLGRDEITNRNNTNGYQVEIQEEWDTPQIKYYHELRTPEGRLRLLTWVDIKIRTATSNPGITIL